LLQRTFPACAACPVFVIFACFPALFSISQFDGLIFALQHEESVMGQEPAATRFSHVKEGQTPYKGGGLRDFFLYRDLGIAGATNGKVIAHLVKANLPPTDGTGWHYHVCEFQIVVMLKGWAKFMYEDKPTLVKAGDVVHQRPGMVHYLFDYSPDMEYMEIVGPADFGTVDAPAPTDKIPPVTPWI
jgi:quercetin dioxygenase-like cupin family protein